MRFSNPSNRSRFPALALKEIDLLARNTTWSYSRDTNLEFEFVGINFYDGQAFLVPKSLDIDSITELNGATICVVSGTSNEINTENYFKKNSIEYKSMPFETFQECQSDELHCHTSCHQNENSGLQISIIYCVCGLKFQGGGGAS